MALKTYNPVTPGQRQLVTVDRSTLYKGAPVKSLTEGQSSTGGRNNNGRITSRFRGGGHKQAYRRIDFRRIGGRDRAFLHHALRLSLTAPATSSIGTSGSTRCW